MYMVPQPPERQQGHPEFHDLREQVMVLFSEGRLGEALESARHLRERYPERGEIPFWIACVLGRLARPDEALQVLARALDAGLWWPAEWLREDDDLVLLRQRPEFDAIVERAERARKSWEESFAPRLIILEPASPSPGRNGTLVTMHGWGGNALDFVDSWRPAVDLGLLLAVPESSQMLSPYFHVWDDRSLAARDLADAYGRLRTTGGIDRRRLVAAGFSQGGGLAVSSVLHGGPIPAPAFLAIGTGLSDIDPADLESLNPTRARELRGWLLVGEDDEALPDAIRLHAELQSRGIACDLEVVPRMAHSLPHDSAPFLRRALASLLPDEGN